MSPLTLRLFAILLIVVMSTYNSAACPANTITRAQYDSIQMNWSRAQVTAAVGNAGDATLESAMETSVTYQGATSGSFAIITFMNGVVAGKAQTALC